MSEVFGPETLETLGEICRGSCENRVLGRCERAKSRAKDVYYRYELSFFFFISKSAYFFFLNSFKIVLIYYINF